MRAAYITGITGDGERLRFERWVYEQWRYGILTDPMLLGCLMRCERFETDY